MKKVPQVNHAGTDRLPATGYIRQSKLIPGIIPISSATLWRWCSSGRFPAPVKLGPAVTAWQVESVRKWMAEHEGRDLNAAASMLPGGRL